MKRKERNQKVPTTAWPYLANQMRILQQSHALGFQHLKNPSQRHQRRRHCCDSPSETIFIYYWNKRESTWTTLQHQQHFNIHQPTPSDSIHQHDNVRFNSTAKGKAQFILHRIQTSIPLREIKAIPKIRQLLVENSCYVHEHRWSEQIWNTTHLGFMVGLDPQYYDVDQATMKINNDIHQKFPRTKIPAFRLVFSTPQIRNDQFYAVTKAYAIETEKANSLNMMQILKTTYQDTATYVPFQLRSKHPEAYARTIRQQSRILASHYVVIMQNIGPDAMFYLEDHIKAIDGVIDVMPSKTVEVTGNYRVLVHKVKFQNIRRELRKNLPLWYKEHVSAEVHPRDDQYLGEPRVAILEEDGYSSGEDTYTAKSIATAFSYEGSIPAFRDLPIHPDQATQQRNQQGLPSSVQATEIGTWADRVRGNNGITNTNHQVSTSIQSQSTSDLISDLASSRAEVEELRTQMSELTASFETQRAELVTFFKEEMARSLSEQLQAITQQQQQQLHLQSSPETTTIDQVITLIQNQDRKFQALTDMVASMMTMAHTTNDKRPPDEMNTSYESSNDTQGTQEFPGRNMDRKQPPSKQLIIQKDIDRAQQSPSHIDHAEMDLSDDSLTPGAHRTLPSPVAGRSTKIVIMIRGRDLAAPGSQIENPYRRGDHR
ncbi:hypothetical protein MHU86_15520 [Fragilaria crotonensis]|nr:hypothetical protein MHU86_15520 [Fragilaria crotonensis]